MSSTGWPSSSPRTWCSRSVRGPASSRAISRSVWSTVHALELDASLEEAARGCAQRDDQRRSRLRGRGQLRLRDARPAADEARLEPALQRRDADRRREPRPDPLARAVGRHGAARGRRALLRVAANEGVRRRVGAPPAPHAKARLASCPARPRSGRARASIRRSSPSSDTRDPASISSDPWSSQPLRTAGRRSRTRSHMPGSPRGPRRSTRSRRSAATPASVPRSSLPRSSSRWRMRSDEGTEAHAKINLGLVVGPRSPRREARGGHRAPARSRLRDTLRSRHPSSRASACQGFEDTIVHRALAAFADATGGEHGWHVRIDKRIPVAAGLGGGSSDAAAALRLANELSGVPLSAERLHDIAAMIGADVPFFLRDGAQLATGDGSELAAVAAPHDIPVVLVLPDGESKESTAAVYRRFDERSAANGFGARRDAMLSALTRTLTPADLAALPRNDLASSPLAAALERAGRLPRRRERRRPDRLRALRGRAVGAARRAGASVVREDVADHDDGRWLRCSTAAAEWQTGQARYRIDLQRRFSLGRGQVVRQRVLVP